MQKRALEPNQDGDQAGKTMRVEGTAAGVVKKPGKRYASNHHRQLSPAFTEIQPLSKNTGPRLPLIMYKEGEPLNLMEYYNKPEGDNTLEVSSTSQSLYTLSDFHPIHLPLYTHPLNLPLPPPFLSLSSSPPTTPITFPRFEFQHTV